MQKITVLVASTFLSRLRGLVGCRLPEGRGLLFPRCSGVHGFLMDRPLDCAFLDAGNRVIRVGTLRPWRVLFGPRGTAAVLEMEAGAAARLGLRPGVWLLPGADPGAMVVAELPERAEGRGGGAAGQGAG
ncbi:MAG: DUF192 domain-containing protein [Bacillota bacterium]